MTIYFTADEHFRHDNIIDHCHRPFRNRRDMEDHIINKANEILSKGDTLYHIGDFCIDENIKSIKQIINKYNKGTNHVLILGNHDKLKPFDYIEAGFQSVHTSLFIRIEGSNLVLNHDPCVYTLIPENSILVCGHVHNLFTTLNNNCINVGVDSIKQNREYGMWDLDSIKNWLKIS